MKTCQVLFIYFDYKIYRKRTAQPTLVKSCNLSDDLGQIEYIFSDKTGTLTQVSRIFDVPIHICVFTTFNFDYPPGAGLSPNPDPVLQRRPSTRSHSTSLAELAVEKSVPQKASLAGALPISHTPLGGHPMHSHSQPYSNATSGGYGYTHARAHTPPPNNGYHRLIPTASSISDIRFPFIYSLIHTWKANFK